MLIQIKSIFESIAENVFKITSVDTAKQFIVDFVNEHRINEFDKKNIIKNVGECKSIYKIHNYIANSLLKYEGLSIHGHSKKETIITITE